MNQYAEQESRDAKLQSEIDRHKDRLQTSRELHSSRHAPRTPSSPPRASRGQTFRSPRPATNYGSYQSNSHPVKSFTAPNPTHRGGGEVVQYMPSSSLEGTTTPAMGSARPLDANSSLKEIIRTSMGELAAGGGRDSPRESPPSRGGMRENSARGQSPSAHTRVQDLSVDEFRSISSRV